MIGYDFLCGILRRWKVLLLPAMLYAYGAFASCRLLRTAGTDCTLPACLLTLMRGCMPPSIGDIFQIPAEWLAVTAGLLLSTLFYPAGCMEGMGLQVLLRSRTRRRWWYGKCLWNFLCCTLYFIIGIGITALFCLRYGGTAALSLSVGNMSGIEWIIAGELGTWDVVRLLILTPALAMFSLSLLQMVLSVRIHQAAAFLICVGILLWSAAIETPLAVGNYTMALRCGELVWDGLSYTTGSAICLALCLICILGGGELFRRQDMLSPKNKGE